MARKPKNPHLGGRRGEHLNSAFQREAALRGHRNPFELGIDAFFEAPELAAFLEKMPLKELSETKKFAKIIRAAFRNYKKEARAMEQGAEQWLEEQRIQHQETL